LNSASLSTHLVMGVTSNGVQPGTKGSLVSEGSQDNGPASADLSKLPQPGKFLTWNADNLGGDVITGDAGLLRATPTGSATYLLGNSLESHAQVFARVGEQWFNISDDAGLRADGTFPFYPALAVSPQVHTILLKGE